MIWFLRRLVSPLDVRELSDQLARATALLAETQAACRTAREALEAATAEQRSLRDELAEARADLRVASRENENLWLVVERDRARVARETAVLARGRAEAEAATAETLSEAE